MIVPKLLIFNKLYSANYSKKLCLLEVSIIPKNTANEFEKRYYFN